MQNLKAIHPSCPCLSANQWLVPVGDCMDYFVKINLV